ncbi:MAG: galactokinase family protein, partial [Akkermansiaceae bacterium]
MLQVNQTINDLVANANADMRRFYGNDGTVVAAAPGRVNLIGEHIDYCDGVVLPLAIERYIVVSAK